MNTDFIADALANEDMTCEATYTDYKGDAHVIRVTFQEASNLSLLGEGPGYRNTNPIAFLDANDFPLAASHANEETLEVGETLYRIIDVELLGSGRFYQFTLSRDPVEPE